MTQKCIMAALKVLTACAALTSSDASVTIIFHTDGSDVTICIQRKRNS